MAATKVKPRVTWVASGNAIQVALWVGVALAFGVWVALARGATAATEYYAAYLLELSLSVDNILVFVIVFSTLHIPAENQRRVLAWGVTGALVFRAVMIAAGITLIQRFEWIIYIFGAFLVYTGIKMFKQGETEIHPDQNPVVRVVTRFFPITRTYEGKHFFTKADGRRAGTLLLLVLIVVEVTDLVFAVDSIPAIFAITTNTFIVYTSNVFAILGLRSMYFLLAGVVEKFHYLRIGLAIVLTFIGAKMLVVAVGFHIPIWISLVFVAVVLLGSVGASLLFARQSDAKFQVDLPPDFDLPLTEDFPEAAEEGEQPDK